MRKVNHLFSLAYKGTRKLYLKIKRFKDNLICKVIFSGNKVKHKGFISQGIPYVSVAFGGQFKIGENFRMNNTIYSNPIGCAQPCMFFVDRNAEMCIGNNVSLSQTALVCHEKIQIGNNVKMGGGVCVYDTDFHALDKKLRSSDKSDIENKKNLPVTISDNVFIGARSVILKGVSIGENSIIAAGSIVTKSVPSNEIWGGNPAKKIRSIF